MGEKETKTLRCICKGCYNSISMAHERFVECGVCTKGPYCKYHIDNHVSENKKCGNNEE